MLKSGGDSPAEGHDDPLWFGSDGRVRVDAAAYGQGRKPRMCAEARGLKQGGRDWSVEFKAIAAALASLPAASVILDGEAVAHCATGLPGFHGLLGESAPSACLYVFDVLAIDGEDMKRAPLV